jgi:phage-related tail fiber protein
MANPSLRINEELAKLPDLRGEFLRGWDNQRDVDPQRKLGSFQNQELLAHDHTIPHQVQVHWPGHGGFSSNAGGNDTNLSNPHTTSSGGTETRPRNIAVNFIIRARP